MLDRLTSMQVFTRVAFSGSFSAAARQMGISQTMVTKHVVAIEERLGVKLLHRTTRRLTLTEAGRRYLEACQRILPEIEEADAAAAAEHVESRGTLRVNVPFSFGLRQIAPALAEFSRLHPRLTVDIGLNDRVVDLIEEGWDLAIRIGRLADSSLVARRLAPCRLALCAAPSYLAAHGTPATVHDLSRHNCLGYTLSRDVGPDRWFFGPAGEIAVKINGTMRANNGDALLIAAVAGQGIVYQPTFLVGDDLRAGRLVAITLDEPTVAASAVHAVFPPDRHPPAKVRAFIDFLAARFSPEPPWDRGLRPDHGEKAGFAQRAATPSPPFG